MASNGSNGSSTTNNTSTADTDTGKKGGTANATPIDPNAKGPSMFETMMQQYPEYMSAWDPNSMSALSQLQQLSPQYSQGFNKFRDEALNDGPSKWLSMTKLAGSLSGRDKAEHMMLENAGQTASARDNLASIGGLSSGARERVEEQGQKNYMSMAQDANRSADMANLQAGVQDETNRTGKLQSLTGMEEQKMGDWEKAKQTDVQNTLTERDRLNKYNMDIYKAKMEALAAERQAQATENAGKK